MSSEPRPVLPPERAPPRFTTNYGAHTRSSAGTDAALLRYGASLLLSGHAAFFAEGARILADNLDYGEAAWHTKAHLDPLLDPNVMLGAMGGLWLFTALGEKEPGRMALAVDALVLSLAQGRVERGPLRATCRDLMRGGLAQARTPAQELRRGTPAHPRDRTGRDRVAVGGGRRLRTGASP